MLPTDTTALESEAQEVAAGIQKLIASAPDRIWLDLGENLESLSDDATFRDLREVTWSEDNATGCGIKYVRAPLAPFLSIDFKQADALLAMFGGEPCEVTLSIAEGHSGRGLYAHYTEYPEEGAEFLGVTDGEAAPDAALSAAPQSDGWRPIESAPKDEVVMLAAEFDRPGDWRMKCGYYQTESGDWRVWGASWKPTMWRPMPTPPKMTQTQGQSHGQ